MNTVEQLREEVAHTIELVRLMVERDRTVHKSYVLDFGLPPIEEIPMCNGHKACAMGSLWLSAGVEPTTENGRKQADYGPEWIDRYGQPGLLQPYLRGAQGIESARARDFAEHPHLAPALMLLNEAAAEWIENHPQYQPSYEFTDPLEQLFEGNYKHYGDEIGKEDLLDVIDTAFERALVVDLDRYSDKEYWAWHVNAEERRREAEDALDV